MESGSQDPAAPLLFAVPGRKPQASSLSQGPSGALTQKLSVYLITLTSPKGLGTLMKRDFSCWCLLPIPCQVTEFRAETLRVALEGWQSLDLAAACCWHGG